MNRIQYIAAWRQTHSSPDIFLIRWFLSIVYLLAITMIKLRLTPNMATLLGGGVGTIAAVFVIQEQWALAAGLALTSSLMDGVDGAIAEIQNAKSKFGAILDVVVDRFIELVWFFSLVYVGAQIEIVVLLGMCILLMEYTRTKANSLGINGAGAITFAERPTRVIMFFMLNLAMLIIGVNETVLDIGIGIMAVLTAFAAVELFVRFANQLRHNSS